MTANPPESDARNPQQWVRQWTADCFLHSCLLCALTSALSRRAAAAAPYADADADADPEDADVEEVSL
eukprot:CAMPEP_0173212386 /NCGR_PEP_ID=MMETSP1141-20130122/24765_1 /TAXON_ID=483371 /ORGANISM="non described non described, Strain CCMP2298" /LENGTH=67 /DNA_ID=CAMNT_0014139387 /DNA_START=2342 /DNA_END=2545 /DNA_ORIENTATION=-